MSENQQIQEIFVEVLKDKFPGLKRENIIVEEHQKNPSTEDRLKAIDVYVMTGKRASSEYVTSIEFKDIEIDHETMGELKKAIDDVSGVWNSYSASDIGFHSSQKDLLETVTASRLKRRLALNKKRPASP